jgi:3-methylcrotonyl-CoA carboxylase beta subunit
MGGEQAASVLAQITRDSKSKQQENWTTQEEEQFKTTIRAQYDEHGHPYHASARLWDDGVIDPVDTRHVLGLGISAALNAPILDTPFGVFRM